MKNEVVAVLAFVALAFGILLVLYWIIGWVQKARGIREETDATEGDRKSLNPAWTIVVFLGIAVFLLVRVLFPRSH